MRRSPQNEPENCLCAWFGNIIFSLPFAVTGLCILIKNVPIESKCQPFWSALLSLTIEAFVFSLLNLSMLLTGILKYRSYKIYNCSQIVFIVLGIIWIIVACFAQHYTMYIYDQNKYMKKGECNGPVNEILFVILLFEMMRATPAEFCLALAILIYFLFLIYCIIYVAYNHCKKIQCFQCCRYNQSKNIGMTECDQNYEKLLTIDTLST